MKDIHIKDNFKWKDNLLKSSLPLEYSVARLLKQSKFFIAGEYSYSRKNEQGIQTEFSVDISAYHFMEKKKDEFWADVNVLVECKYNHPNVKWIFTPNPDDESIVAGLINVFQELCTKYINCDPIYKLDNELEYCIKGIEIDHRNLNPNGIKHGINQLRFAIPSIVKRILKNQSTEIHEVDNHIEFLCPILVTTAPLFVIKEGLNLSDFVKAKRIEEIVKNVEALIYYQEVGSDLSSHIYGDNNFFENDIKKIYEKLSIADNLDTQEDEFRKIIRSEWIIEDQIKSVTNRVLVVNYKHFSKYINEIMKSIKNTSKSLTYFATSEYDRVERKKIYIPIS